MPQPDSLFEMALSVCARGEAQFGLLGDSKCTACDCFCIPVLPLKWNSFLEWEPCPDKCGQ